MLEHTQACTPGSVWEQFQTRLYGDPWGSLAQLRKDFREETEGEGYRKNSTSEKIYIP